MLNFKDEACRPTKGSKYSAAIDLYASEDVEIGEGETVIIPLGVTIDLELLRVSLKQSKEHFYSAHVDVFRNSHYLQLEPRSSLRAKGLQAGTGIIDLDYPDEIKLILHNPVNRVEYSSDMKDKGSVFTIHKGDKIAQIMLCEHKTYLMGVETGEERVGGLGSTGS